MLALAPISWISGVVLLIKATEMGARRVFLPNPTPRSVLFALQKYKVSPRLRVAQRIVKLAVCGRTAEIPHRVHWLTSRCC